MQPQPLARVHLQVLRGVSTAASCTAVAASPSFPSNPYHPKLTHTPAHSSKSSLGLPAPASLHPAECCPGAWVPMSFQAQAGLCPQATWPDARFSGHLGPIYEFLAPFPAAA